ncbi:MAG: type II secretion system GspH family protein [Candidatus Omnitrophica bacterium]|nr:type II secretion system GspH family protein [Candidatus Omnitrophota bacterium]
MRAIIIQPVLIKNNKNAFTLLELIIVLALLAIVVSAAVARFVDVASRSLDIQENATIAALRSAILLYRADTGSWPTCPPFMDDADVSGAAWNWWMDQGCGFARSANEVMMQNSPPHAWNSYGGAGKWGICKSPGTCSGAACVYQIWCPHGSLGPPKTGNYWEYNVSTGSLVKDPTYPGHQ